MKQRVLYLLLVASLPLAAQYPFSAKPAPPPPPPEQIYDNLEEMPEFPGGPEAMQQYLDEHISRPAVMRGICSSSRLIAGFVVEKDGSISQIDIVKSINGCPDFDYDVIKAIRNMPKWKPGKLNGKKVRAFYKMPVYIG
ncbi:MAG: energy transducer TonB [Bacteroidia bacterium]|nr:energy transducer TonB [Bacteroidia bacterium]